MTEEAYRFAAFFVAIVTSLVVLAITILPAFVKKDDWRSAIVRSHPTTALGIPVAGCSSFVVITFFGAVAGPIKINLWGLQIEGAGGPVLLWILCLLALSLAARMTWGLKPKRMLRRSACCQSYADSLFNPYSKSATVAW